MDNESEIIEDFRILSGGWIYMKLINGEKYIPPHIIIKIIPESGE